MAKIKFFTQQTILSGFFIILLSIIPVVNYANTVKIKFAYIGPIDSQFYHGVSQGLNEANLQGRFLGQEYALDIVELNAINNTNLSQYIALLVVADSETLLMLNQTSQTHPVFNLAADDDALRDACLNNVLHILPSARMKQDAVAQWNKKHPGMSVEAKAWHPAFIKFAARDLNKRFRKAFDNGMNDESWSGWAAIKMTADTVAREAITNPYDLLNYLKTNLSFDGQKGLNMNFRETGQLRQILLIVEHGQLVGEAPVRGVAKTGNVDSLGISHCPK